MWRQKHIGTKSNESYLYIKGTFHVQTRFTGALFSHQGEEKKPRFRRANAQLMTTSFWIHTDCKSKSKSKRNEGISGLTSKNDRKRKPVVNMYEIFLYLAKAHLFPFLPLPPPPPPLVIFCPSFITMMLLFSRPSD